MVTDEDEESGISKDVLVTFELTLLLLLLVSLLRFSNLGEEEAAA